MDLQSFREIVHEDISIASRVNKTSESEEFLNYAVGILINGEER